MLRSETYQRHLAPLLCYFFCQGDIEFPAPGARNVRKKIGSVCLRNQMIVFMCSGMGVCVCVCVCACVCFFQAFVRLLWSLGRLTDILMAFLGDTQYSCTFLPPLSLGMTMKVACHEMWQRSHVSLPRWSFKSRRVICFTPFPRHWLKHRPRESLHSLVPWWGAVMERPPDRGRTCHVSKK